MDATIAGRSANTAVTLRVRCCLRCSKRFGGDIENVCGHRGPDTSCTQCARKRKPCRAIPARFINRFNILYGLVLAARDLGPGAAKEAAIQKVVTKQKTYTKLIEAHVRARRNAGAARPPANTVEGLMVILPVLVKISETLDGLLDLGRFNARLPPIVADSDDDDLGDDEDEDDADA